VLGACAVANPTERRNVFGRHGAAVDVAACTDITAGSEHLADADFRMVADQAAKKLHAGVNRCHRIALIANLAVGVFQIRGGSERAEIHPAPCPSVAYETFMRFVDTRLKNRGRDFAADFAIRAK